MLVFNKVYALYFYVVMNCYLFMRSYMMKLYNKSYMNKFYDKVHCCYDNKHDATMFVFCFYRHLSLKPCGHAFQYRLSLEDKRGLSLGELIRPFCIMISYCYLLCFVE